MIKDWIALVVVITLNASSAVVATATTTSSSSSVSSKLTSSLFVAPLIGHSIEWNRKSRSMLMMIPVQPSSVKTVRSVSSSKKVPPERPLCVGETGLSLSSSSTHTFLLDRPPKEQRRHQRRRCSFLLSNKNSDDYGNSDSDSDSDSSSYPQQQQNDFYNDYNNNDDNFMISTTTSKRRRNKNKPRPGSMADLYLKTGKVPYGEDSRQYRRTVFLRHTDWSRHRSPDRLFKNLRYLYRSGICRQLTRGVQYVSSMALLVVVWNTLLLSNVAVASAYALPKLSLPAMPFTLSSSALGLLLVFRTNASYQRWLEGQNNIVKIVSELKNILRMTSTWLPYNYDENENEKKKKKKTKNEEYQQILETVGIKCWTILRSLQCHLRGNTAEEEKSFSTHIRNTLGRTSSTSSTQDNDTNDNNNNNNNTARTLINSKDRPFWAINDLSAMVWQTLITHINNDGGRLREMDKAISSITSSVESCTKSIRYPVPLVYTRHTSRFLSFWLLLLPLALYDTFEKNMFAAAHSSILLRFLECFLLVPTSAMISLFFFGIDELAIQLEEPFGILPLEYNCANMKLIAKEATLWYTTRGQGGRGGSGGGGSREGGNSKAN